MRLRNINRSNFTFTFVTTQELRRGDRDPKTDKEVRKK